VKKSDLPEGSILEIVGWEESGGLLTIIFLSNDAFKDWFKDLHGLKRWSNKKFEKAVNNSFGFSKKYQEFKTIFTWEEPRN